MSAAGPLGAAIVRDASQRGEGIRDWAARVGVGWGTVYGWIAGRGTPRKGSAAAVKLVAALPRVARMVNGTQP